MAQRYRAPKWYTNILNKSLNLSIKFYIITLGCKVNQYESQALREAWKALGWRECVSPEQAELLLVNSCAVTASAVSDVRAQVRRLHALAPQAQILIMGCSAEVQSAEMQALPGVKRVIRAAEKDDFYHNPVTFFTQQLGNNVEGLLVSSGQQTTLEAALGGGSVRPARPVLASELSSGLSSEVSSKLGPKLATKLSSEFGPEFGPEFGAELRAEFNFKQPHPQLASETSLAASNVLTASSLLATAKPDLKPAVKPDVKPAVKPDVKPGAKRAYPPFSVSGYNRARAVLKVQDGCSHFCTYCIVPLARGRAVSRSPADVLQEVQRLLKAGFTEITLSGINLSQYAWQNDLPHIQPNVPGSVAGSALGEASGNASGNALGNASGNALGNASGNSLGNVPGNVAGNSLGNASGSALANASGNALGNALGEALGNTSGYTQAHALECAAAPTQENKRFDFWDLLVFLEKHLAATRNLNAESGARFNSSFAALPFRLRISSLEPGQLDRRALEILSQSKIVCPQLHISLQSGSPAVLKRMGRGHYNPASLLEFCAELKKFWPQFGLGADLLVGFPGETNEEFEETKKLVQALPFTYAHVFPFSARPGTKAASFPHAVPKPVRTKRAASLRKIIEEKKQAFLEFLLAQGKPLHMVLESRESGLGVCEYYVECCLREVPPEAQPKDCLKVMPIALQGERLLVKACC